MTINWEDLHGVVDKVIMNMRPRNVNMHSERMKHYV